MWLKGAAVAGMVALAGAPGRAWASAADRLELSQETGSERGVDEAAALSAAAELRLAAGDRAGAIALWRQAFTALPGGYGYAPRRAAAALAIAGAEEAIYRDGGDPARLRAAIAALDAYLGGLDPTDDENRARVEDRRAELSDMYKRASTPAGPSAPPRADLRRRGIERRAGLVAAGLAGGAAVAGVIALAGGLTGQAADRDLARATARPCQGEDPADRCGSDGPRETIKADLLADGLRANWMAKAGAAAAGGLLAAGAAALLGGLIRGRGQVQARGPALLVRF